jgi:hypothetical protein
MYRLKFLILLFFILSSVVYIVLSDEIATVKMTSNANDDQNETNGIHLDNYNNVHQTNQNQSLHQSLVKKSIVQVAIIHDKVKVVIDVITSIITSPVFTLLNKQLQFINKIIKSKLQQSVLLTRQIIKRFTKLLINIFDDKIHSKLSLLLSRLIHLIQHTVDRIFHNCDPNKLILLLTVCYSVVQLVV